jgi:hypothetical protein
MHILSRFLKWKEEKDLIQIIQGQSASGGLLKGIQY